MEHLEKIIDMCEDELKTLAKNGKFKSREEIAAADQLAHTMKSLACLMDMWSEDESEYSQDDGYSMRGGSYSRDGRSYGGDSSYARGRGRNARRDSMGRYSRDGGGSREGGYSREGSYRRGYSRDGKEEYVDQLRDMLRDAPDENTRQGIQRMIQQMEG